jgi:DNA topoisomerase-1
VFNIILVENDNILTKIKDIIPTDFTLISLLETFKTNDLCSGIFQNKINVTAQITKIRNQIKSANSVFIIFSSEDENYKLLIASIKYFEIQYFRKVEVSNFSNDTVQLAFNNARLIEKDEINYLIAKLDIDLLISCKISSILRWYYYDKEKILSKEDVSNIYISRAILYALNILVSNEDKINNFYPETYKKVGVDYSYDNIQFRVNNKLKFKEDMESELLSFYNIIQDNNNINVVDHFKRDTKDKMPPKPLTSLTLQKSCNYQFGFEPKYTMKLATALHNGIKIGKNKVSLITSPHTNSHRIDPNKIEAISNLITGSFGKEYLNLERDFAKQDSEIVKIKEAIIPINFNTPEYSPKKLIEYLDEDLLKLYEYIYYRTVATQMSNLVIDATELIVDIDGNKFKAISNKILFDGWYKLGKHWMDHDIINKETIELPQRLYAGQILEKLETVIYEVPERTPFRYGIGRFIEKATKELDVDFFEVTALPEDLIKYQYVKVLSNMLHPIELGKQIFYFFEEYLPEIYDDNFYANINKSLKEIKDGKMDKTVLIDEITVLLNLLQDRVGYISKNHHIVDEALVRKAQKIATQNNQILSDVVLNNTALLNKFISQNNNKLSNLGFCIKCKDGTVYEQEKGFICNNKDCNFTIWHNTIASFFKHYQKTFSQHNHKEIIKVILEKGHYIVADLYSQKKDLFFTGKLVLKENMQYKRWELSLCFENKTSTNDNQIITEPDQKIEQSQTIKEDNIDENLELKKQIKELREKTLRCPKTRAFNYECFQTDINKIFDTNETQYALAFIDADHFGNLNNTYGHEAGDKVLVTLVNLMFENTRDYNCRVYRYGGEEFLISFTKMQKSEILRIANTLKGVVEDLAIVHNQQTIKFTISIGISLKRDTDTTKTIIERADENVYKAKENGRNRIEIDD